MGSTASSGLGRAKTYVQARPAKTPAATGADLARASTAPAAAQIPPVRAERARPRSARPSPAADAALPDELVASILSFLGPLDRLAAAGVDRRWHRVADDPAAWPDFTLSLSAANSSQAAAFLGRRRHAQLGGLDLILRPGSDAAPALAAAPPTLRSLSLRSAADGRCEPRLPPGCLARLPSLECLLLSVPTGAGQFGRVAAADLADAFAGAGSNLREVCLSGDLALDVGDPAGVRQLREAFPRLRRVKGTVQGRGDDFVRALLDEELYPAALCFESLTAVDRTELARAIAECVEHGLVGVGDCSYEWYGTSLPGLGGPALRGVQALDLVLGAGEPPGGDHDACLWAIYRWLADGAHAPTLERLGLTFECLYVAPPLLLGTLSSLPRLRVLSLAAPSPASLREAAAGLAAACPALLEYDGPWQGGEALQAELERRRAAAGVAPRGLGRGCGLLAGG